MTNMINKASPCSHSKLDLQAQIDAYFSHYKNDKFEVKTWLNTQHYQQSFSFHFLRVPTSMWFNQAKPLLRVQPLVAALIISLVKMSQGVPQLVRLVALSSVKFLIKPHEDNSIKARSTSMCGGFYTFNKRYSIC